MDPKAEFQEKLDAFLTTHRQILADFQRSLVNARHFMQLAEKAAEHEPENAVVLLEQIKEIDLLGHLERQSEEFQSVASLMQSGAGEKLDGQVRGLLGELDGQYQALVEEAADQMEGLDRMLFSLQNMQ